jgi:hypothetical protein
MCHVQSLEKDFYLGTPSSFDYIFTQYNMGVKVYFYLLHPKIRSYYNSTHSLKKGVLVFIDKKQTKIIILKQKNEQKIKCLHSMILFR